MTSVAKNNKLTTMQSKDKDLGFMTSRLVHVHFIYILLKVLALSTKIAYSKIAQTFKGQMACVLQHALVFCCITGKVGN